LPQVSATNEYRKSNNNSTKPISLNKLLSSFDGSDRLEKVTTTPVQKAKCLCYPGSYWESFDETVKLLCNEGNIADIFIALQSFTQPDKTRPSPQSHNPPQSILAIDEMVIDSAPSMSRLFGPLLHGKTIRSFSVTRSNVSEISEDVFRDLTLVGSLSSLNFAENSFTSVPRAVTHFPEGNNLTHLSLARNQIVTIPPDTFKSLPNLTHLDLGSNLISTLSANSFAGLVSLEALLLEFNSLSKFERNLFKPIARRLRVLDVSHNSFSKVGQSDFNELGQLTHLNMSHNQLQSLPRSSLARVSQLMYLDLAANQFTSVDSYLLRGVRFLRHFNASYNSISELSRGALKSITRIKQIDLSYNSLEEIPPDVFINLSWLDELYLGFNRITRIKSGAFDRLYKFAIDLQSNNLSVIESGAFLSCTNITLLNLYNNSVSYVGPLAFGGTDQDVSDVTELNLSFNSLISLSNFSVLSNFTGLKLLNLSHNSISGHIDRRSSGLLSQKRLYEVHTIDLSYNAINEISGHIFEKFASVRLINLTQNALLRIGSASFGNIPTILTLDLSHNNISEISSGAFIHLISLRELYLQDNKLKKVFAGVPFSLTDLHLQNNEIEEVSPGIFPFINSLLKLNLDSNRLVRIGAGALRHLRSLQSISLAHNEIVEIPREALQDCSFSLQNITLSHNRITLLDRQAFGQLPIVFHIQLQNNEIAQLRSLAFDGLLQLITLNMSSNRIAKLPYDTFNGLVSLQQLDLSHNMLVQVSENARNADASSTPSTLSSPFEPLLSVHTIDLSHNHISYVNDHSFPKSPWIPYKLTRVSLLNNPLEALGVTRYIHKYANISSLELDKNEDYTVWLSDTCRCTCPSLSTCIGYGKRSTQVQPKCKLEFCSP
jgi:Leucine-rich repeat (LRR) protein